MSKSQKKNHGRVRDTVGNTTLEFISTELIVTNSDNPRILNKSSQSYIDLVDSIRASGVLVPVHVRKHPKQKGKYDLLAGERRLIAALECKLRVMPALNHDGMSDAQAFELTFAENFAREDLTAMEQGKAVVTLMRKYKDDTEAVASKMGKSVKWVRQRMALAKNLSEKAQDMIKREPVFAQWTTTHLQRVAGFPAEVQVNILEWFWQDEPPTLKKLDEYLQTKLSVLSKAPWDLKDAKRLPKTKACNKCPKRSSVEPCLFDETIDIREIRKNDRCLDIKCWQQKMRAYLEARSKEIRKDHPKLIGAVTPGQQLSHNEAYNIRNQYGEIATDYKLANGSDKDAVPALVVCGADVGKLLFIKLPKPKAGQPAVKGKTAKTVTPLKDRRAMLELKRWFVTVQKVIEQLKKKQISDITTKNKLLTVMALIVEFGTKELNRWDSSSRYIERNSWRSFAKKTDQKKVLAELWGRAKKSITAELTYTGPITQTPDDCITGAKTMAKITGIDVKAIYKQACEKYPKPKCWAGLNEDGTLKKSKVKKSTKKAKKNVRTRTARTA